MNSIQPQSFKAFIESLSEPQFLQFLKEVRNASDQKQLQVYSSLFKMEMDEIIASERLFRILSLNLLPAVSKESKLLKKQRFKELEKSASNSFNVK